MAAVHITRDLDQHPMDQCSKVAPCNRALQAGYKNAASMVKKEMVSIVIGGWGMSGLRRSSEAAKTEKQEKGRIAGGWTSHATMACLGYLRYGAIRR